jgi:hypothetical protein
MPVFEQSVIREPGAESSRDYGRRVHRLAVAYVVLFVGSATGIVLLVWRGQFFVSLTQHSNVETLTLAFLMIFFLYLGVLSAPGVSGALRVVYYDGLLPRLGTARGGRAAQAGRPGHLPPARRRDRPDAAGGEAGRARPRRDDPGGGRDPRAAGRLHAGRRGELPATLK